MIALSSLANTFKQGSWAEFLEVLTLTKVHQAYNRFVYRHSKDKDFPEEDIIDEDDFEALKRLFFFLKALYDTTKFLEGLTATLKRVLPTQEYLLEHFENRKVYTYICVGTQPTGDPNVPLERAYRNGTKTLPGISQIQSREQVLKTIYIKLSTGQKSECWQNTLLSCPARLLIKLSEPTK